MKILSIALFFILAVTAHGQTIQGNGSLGGSLNNSLGGGIGIGLLPQFTATSTPFDAITTLIHGKDLFLPYGNATTSSLAVTDLLNCDTIDTDASGNFSCGTDGGGGGTYIGLSDTPGSFTAEAVPYTNAGASALLHSSSFTFDGTTLDAPVINASTVGTGFTVGGLVALTRSGTELQHGFSGSVLTQTIYTNAVARITVASGGNVGIGTTTPSSLLSVNGDTSTAGITATGTVNINSINGVDYNPGSDVDVDLITVGVTGSPTIIWDESSDGFMIQNGTGLVISENSDGDLTHTIAGTAVSSSFEVHSEGSSEAGGIISHRHTDVDNFGGHMLFARSDGTHASPGVVDDDDTIARIIGLGYDGTDYELAAEIQITADGNFSNNNGTGKISILTNPGGQALVEQITIRGDGNTGFGTTSPKSTVDINGSFACVASTTAISVTLDSECYVDVDTSSGNITINLPTASSAFGRVYDIRKSTSDTNNVIIDPSGSETINGDSTKEIKHQYNSITVKSVAGNWVIQ